MHLAEFRNLFTRKRLSGLGFILAVILLITFITMSAAAQSADSWSEPENLSQSGSASDPSMVIDSDGVYHILWLDEFAGPIYVTGDGTEWSEPRLVNLPFGDSIPTLASDDSGYIHAFWRDSEGTLYYGRARANAFHSPSAWGLRAQLAESALEMDVVKDDQGNMHLSYVRPIESSEFPAGIYYRQIRTGTSTWSSPVLLYESPYFRSLSVEDSNVDVSTGLVDDQVQVYVAWDNQPRERVYLIKSGDGGQNWDIPREIDKPDTGIGTRGSANIRVDAGGSSVLLIWQANHNEANCDQFYQFSHDAGITWSSRQRMNEEFVVCPQDNQILAVEDGSLLLMKGIEVYLQAWNGDIWSEPQYQQSLTAFIDPDTDRLVDFNCQQASIVGGASLYVVGCDDDVGKDIWLINRQLFDLESWYPEEAVWSAEASVTNREEKISSPALVSDSQERMHAVWSQSDSTSPDGLGDAIFYSRWEDGQWTPPEKVIDPSEGKAEQPAITIGEQDQLFLVWSGGQDGEIYFSSADAGQAIVPSSWKEPVQLPSLSLAGSSPSIVVADEGVIYVAYAIPLNESRGIYVVISRDGGQTWSEPQQVFNAEAAGWSMVDGSRLASTDQDHLHILWTQSTLPSGRGPLALLYSNSVDGGDTWSAPQVIVENPVAWSQVVGIGDAVVQRIWQETGSSGTTMWHEESLDNGESWFRTVPVSVFGDTEGYPSLTADGGGRLHLLLPVRRSAESIVVQHWLYDDGRWSAERNLELTFPTNVEIDSIVGQISDSGNLGVLIADTLQFAENYSHQFQLSFFHRLLEIPTSANTQSQPTATSVTITPSPEATEPSVQPTLTPVPTGSTETPTNILAGSNSPGNTSWLAIGGPIFIGFIVLVAVFLIFRGVRKSR